ncbi:MAG TPA: TAXI family TRAP transporter solute-binding subunit [Polyangia bacterium]|nr:TAXI family TRAP transporter solute-binding subunit [Polyangia bacterium]
MPDIEKRPSLAKRIASASWRDLLVVGLPTALVIGAAVGVAIKAASFAPPKTIRFISGPDGSSFRNQAEKYQKILARDGVKLEILPSRGAIDNLDKLANRAAKVDVGFVQGGLAEGRDLPHLVSLGSVYPQPLMIYCRSNEPVELLSELKGKRLAIGPEGSGTRVLALKLLKANEMDGPPTVLHELAGDEAAKELLAGKIDAAFLMGDSATQTAMRSLREQPHIQLMSFRQAEGYLRKFRFLSKLTLPEGAMDLGKNYPPRAMTLIGPTVELVARDDLHPALSDLLIRAAREVHGSPGMFRNAGEYPAPLARDFPISADAERYYKSGEQFLYKRLPFWLASLVDRLLVLLLPLLVVIVPATRLAPAVYRWRVRSRIYRWYGALMAIEREMRGDHTPEEKEAIRTRLDAIANAVSDLKTPPSFADQLYVLRDHVAAVRRRLDVAAAS